MIKKYFLLASAFIFITYLSITTVHAEDFTPTYSIPNPVKYDSLEDIISAAAALIRPVFLLTFGAMLLYGAWMILTSKGDADKVANGRKTVIAAIIGFAIAVLAPTIANLVTNFLGVKGLDL